MTRRTKKVALPNSKTITLSGDLEAKLYYDSISDDIVENTVNEIKKVDGTYPNFKALVENNAHKPLQFYVYNDRDSYQKHTESTSKYGHYDHNLNTMYTYIDPNDNDPFLLDAIHIAHSERLLPKTDRLKLNDNLQVILHHNGLKNDKLKAIEQKIKDNFNEYEELFGIEDHGPKTMTFFVYDDKKDYDKYGYTSLSYGIKQVDVERENIINAYRYIDGDDVPLRMQVSYALSHHNVGKGLAMLPEREEIIKLPKSNVQIKLDTNDLDDKEVKIAKKEIIDTFRDIKFDTYTEINLDRYNIDDGALVSLLKKVRPREDYDHESAKEALEDPTVQRDMPILLSDKTKVEKSQMLLTHKEIIEFPQYNFEVEFYHNLKGYALERAKQEIINDVYSFKEAFGLRAEHPKNPDITSKFRVFIYENSEDFRNYGGIARGYAEGAGCDTYIANAYTYQYAPSEAPIEAMRHELGHALANYVNGCRFPEDPIGEGMAAYPQRQFHPLNSEYESRVYGKGLIEEIQSSAVLDISHENYLYRIPAFFAETYPEVMKDIFQNRTLYNNPLEHFKNKFPFLVSHISSKESFDSYGYKFLSRIFEKPEIKQKFLDFVKSKVAESKYIDEVRDLNAFRVVKGDHIGTDKNTDEEYYIGMIVDDRGEIGAFSPIEYSVSSKGIKVLNHATHDSIVIPKKYHNLKLVKVDSNYKLAFCDKRGNEYRNTQECKNQTEDFLYTDDAQEAFALVDLHSLQGITGKEENLGKIFSIKSTNSKSIMSIYDSHKEVGSFTNEIGYINRNKFHFKDEHSTDFKIYDKNRALIIITKEDDEYKLSLADGNYIDDDNKFLKQSTELSSNEIDVHDTHSKGTAITEFFEREDTLLFRYGPGPENEKTITLSGDLEAKLYYENLSDDIVENIVNQIKRQDEKYYNFKELVDKNANKPLQFYVYDTKNSYRAHTGSTSKYGHFDHSSNTMYTYKDPDADDAFLTDATRVAQNERVLPKKEIIKLSNEELQIDLYYNNLSSRQLEAVKQEIESTFYDFKNLYGVKQYGTDKILSIFLHDNKKDYDKYAYTEDEGMGQYSHESTNFANMYYYIYDDPEGSLRHQISYALTYYNGRWDRGKILPDLLLSTEKIVEFNEYNFTVKVHHNLSDDKLQKAVNEIKNNLFGFKILLNLRENDVSSRELELYICNGKSDCRGYTKPTIGYGHFDPVMDRMYISRSSNHPGDITLEPIMRIAQNEKVLPKEKIVAFSNEELQVKLHYNNLTTEQLKTAEQDIRKTFYDFKNLYDIKEYGTNKIINIFLHDNREDYDKYAYTKDEGMGQYDKENTNVVYIYYNIHNDPEGTLRHQVSYALTYYNGGWDRNKILSDREELSDTEIQGNELEEEEVIEFPQYNLKVRIHYNDLSDDQLEAAKKEIKKTFSDFNKSFKLEKSNSPRELQLYIYDNRGDFTKHTGSDADGIASPYWNGDNVAKMSIYKLDDDGVGFTEYLRHELAHGLTFYCNGSPGLTCGQKADYGLTLFLLEGIARYIHEGSNLPGGSTFNPEDYYKDGHKLVSLLERCYPKVIDRIIHNNNLYKNALKHFKAEFPNLVSHISDDESFSVYDEAFFERIFDNDEVVRTFEENDNNISEDLSDMSYKMVNGSLQITDRDTDETVKIPKQFKYLRLEEDDEGEYKLVLCNKKGRAFSDNKKYAKMDDKYKYINTKAVNLDEDIEFDDYDEEDLFFIQPDETNSQVVKILDVYEDEIGMLSNNDFI